jgi:predicted DsbA family dithiol-disulfide isomerase
MHDTLFTNQHALGLSDLLAYADEIGLDRARFSRDLQEHRFLPKVRRDFMEGVRSGVNGTPTIFINGERWNGPYTAAALLAGIRGQRSPDVEPMTGLPWGFSLAGL